MCTCGPYSLYYEKNKCSNNLKGGPMEFRGATMRKSRQNYWCCFLTNLPAWDGAVARPLAAAARQLSADLGFTGA